MRIECVCRLSSVVCRLSSVVCRLSSLSSRAPSDLGLGSERAATAPPTRGVKPVRAGASLPT
eukprot:2999270-Rhodomonas_salina.1